MDVITWDKMHVLGMSYFLVAPMRGRGFGRGVQQNRHDPFRSRAPNTSRPPSMHVDDFIKMENQGNVMGQNMNRVGSGSGEEIDKK